MSHSSSKVKYLDFGSKAKPVNIYNYGAYTQCTANRARPQPGHLLKGSGVSGVSCSRTQSGSLSNP